MTVEPIAYVGGEPMRPQRPVYEPFPEATPLRWVPGYKFYSVTGGSIALVAVLFAWAFW